MLPSGNKEGVPSLESPNGSNASNPPKGSIDAELAFAVELRLREGLKERVSYEESGKAKERSGGGFGAGGAKDDAGPPVEVGAGTADIDENPLPFWRGAGGGKAISFEASIESLRSFVDSSFSSSLSPAR